MIPVDGAVTTVLFGTPESSIAQGSAFTDGRGERGGPLSIFRRTWERSLTNFLFLRSR
ncbi:MAG: hypothetical protein IPK56_10925 [Elusimicrobia bacterium]|nr:hypothetical protein [Elusimicrobiota bacterium]